jgi:hypothetical protein
MLTWPFEVHVGSAVSYYQGNEKDEAIAFARANRPSELRDGTGNVLEEFPVEPTSTEKGPTVSRTI